MSRIWTALPNFVDCAVFRPVASAAEKQSVREALGLPASAFVVGCVAAVKKDHKRVDYLIREFACFYKDILVAGSEESEQKDTTHLPSRASCPSFQNGFLRPYLLIAGAKTDETAELLALAESLIPGRYTILTDCSRDRMPGLLRAMDVFVLTSLFEMMPIAVLEALATGLPVISNDHPVLTWMTGAGEEFEQKERKGLGFSAVLSAVVPEAEGGSKKSSLFPSFPSVQETSSCGGLAIDMSLEGALARALAGLTPEWIEAHGRQARERAMAMFSKETVIRQYVEYYKEVMIEE